MTPFEGALAFTLKEEGGYVDDPLDIGGPTNCGVTQRSFDRWKMLHNGARRSVKDITEDEVRAIYHECYWLPAGCDELPERIDVVMFDSAVNMGPVAAVRLLQRAAWVEEDGTFGPDTLAAARAVPIESLCHTVLTLRRLHYLDKQRSPFMKGWLARLERLRDYVGT